MLCWTWWSILLLVLGAAAVGFILCFLWHWWLLSRPGAKSR
jgi:hypothetical protein